MCTDIRLVRLSDRHISGRTLDFGYDVESRVQVVPRGQDHSAVATDTSAQTLTWSNDLGYVGMDAFGFAWAICDGLNEAGLSVGTLWLPETKLPTSPPTDDGTGVIDFVNLAGWILGTCRTVDDVRAALASVRIWNAPVKRLWQSSEPLPKNLVPLADYAFTEHLTIHDASGGDLVVEFIDGETVFHDNKIGVLTNSPTYDWHTTNLRNYIGLTNVEDKPLNLMGMPVTPTGNGTGLLGMPGDVTPASRFIRATVLTEVATSAKDTRDAINQTIHSLDLVSVARFLAASGDYTQWYVARDHDDPTYYVRAYDSWQTDVHRLADLNVNKPGATSSLSLPTA